MAFWAMGAFDKIKNISIKQVTKKVKDYVHVVPEEPTIKPKQQQQVKPKPIKVKISLSQSELMEIQLRQYKKLLKLQEKIVGEHERKQKQEIQIRQKELQILQNELIQKELQQRKNEEKNHLLQAIQQGKKSIEEIIEENIEIKQIIYFTKQK